MKTLIRWLVKKFMPGYHLAKNPPNGRKKADAYELTDPEKFEKAMSEQSRAFAMRLGISVEEFESEDFLRELEKLKERMMGKKHTGMGLYRCNLPEHKGPKRKVSDENTKAD